MSSHVAAISPLPASGGWAKTVWRAWRSLTWREWRLGLCYAIANFVLVAPVNLVYSSGSEGMSVATLAIGSVTFAAFLVACVSVADKVAPPRAMPWAPYLVAAVASAVLETIAQSITVWAVGGSPYDQWNPAIYLPSTFASFLQSGLVATFAYAQYRWSNGAAAALHAVQLERARVQREVVAVRLRELQARVEPLFLFDTLRGIEEICVADRLRADRILGALIDYLRAALPDLAVTASRLGRELLLSQSYVAVATGLRREPVPFDIDVGTELLDLYVAPGAIPTLVASLVPTASAAESSLTAIAVSARAVGDRLHVVVCANYLVPPDAAIGNVQAVDALLRDAHEGDAKLARRASSPTCIEYELELPHERTHRNDR